MTTLQQNTTVAFVRRFISALIEKRMNDWIALWDDDGVIEFPFAPDGRRQFYRGRDAILAHMSRSMDRVEILDLRYFNLHALACGDAAVLEMGTRARIITPGPQYHHPYNQTYVIFFETRCGKMWRYREYWNSMTLADAIGGRDQWSRDWGQPDGSPRERPFLVNKNDME